MCARSRPHNTIHMPLYYYEKELGLTTEDIFWEKDQLHHGAESLNVWKEQREKYGFDERETWQLYFTIALFVYPRLKMYNGSNKRPIGMPNNEWKEKLGEMLQAFECILKCEVDDSDENEEMVQQGLNCFAKYFLYLWD